MKPTLLIPIVLILSCTLLLGQAQPSPWLPHVVSAEMAKVVFRDMGSGILDITYDNAGELFLMVSVRFDYKGSEGERTPLPPYAYVIEGTVETPYSCCPATGSVPVYWRHLVPNAFSQSSLDCLQLLSLQQQSVTCRSGWCDKSRLSAALQVYSPAICAGKSFMLYFSLPDEWKTQTFSLIFQEEGGTKHPPIPLHPKPVTAK
jgi:hypothetical protein